MNVSLDGLRLNLINTVKVLKRKVHEEYVENYNEYEIEEIIDAVDSVIEQANILLCVFNEEDNHFNDMSEKAISFLGDDLQIDEG